MSTNDKEENPISEAWRKVDIMKAQGIEVPAKWGGIPDMVMDAYHKLGYERSQDKLKEQQKSN